MSNNNGRSTVRRLHDHGERVGVLAYELSLHLKLSKQDCMRAYIAGRYHDMGKLMVPFEILDKNEKLNTFEMGAIKEHPGRSRKFLSAAIDDNKILDAVYHHHENFNGSGYPDGISDNNIPLLARLLRICDVFDALREERPYKPAMPLELISKIMEDDFSKGVYDPEIFEVFQKIKLSEKG